MLHFIIRETQIKNTTRYQISKTKNGNSKCWSRCEAPGTHALLAVQSVTPALENCLTSLAEVEDMCSL